MENEFDYPDGTKGWFELSIQSTFEGAFILSVDITERKQAEKDLQDSQARLAGIINSAIDAIISLDSDQHILLFNPAAKFMFGYDQAEVLGQSVEQFLPERFRAGHSKHIQHFEQTGITNRTME